MKVFIVDDERLARNALRRLLKLQSDLEIVGEATNADEALLGLRKCSPDVIFLDVEMPGCSGFELLKRLDDLPIVIFTTAYDAYAVRAFEASALDYLVKPITSERLVASLHRARRAIGSPSKEPVPSSLNKAPLHQIFVRDGERCWIVRLADIVLMESEGNYTRLYFGNNTPLIYRSLLSIEERLSGSSFFRANRSQIINLRWIDQVETDVDGGLIVKLSKDHKIEISRRQTRKLKDLLSL